jgi:hypothetical protein
MGELTKDPAVRLIPARNMLSRTVGSTSMPPPIFIRVASSSSVKKNTMLGRLAFVKMKIAKVDKLTARRILIIISLERMDLPRVN